MKKVFLCLFIALATIVTSSCGKIDKRDEFVGDYSMKIHGEFAFDNGQSQTIDLEDLTLTISKAEGFGNLKFSGFYDCDAKVVGDVIVIGSMHIRSNTSDGYMDMEVQESNGLFGDGNLTFVNEITGTYYVQGNSYDFDAWFSNEAVKLN